MLLSRQAFLATGTDRTLNRYSQGTLRLEDCPSDLSKLSNPVARVIGSPDYVLMAEMPIHSKARPRLTRSGHAYMPQAYREAQAQMRSILIEQWDRPALQGPIALYIKVYGEGRGDADNIAGFLMDAAGPAKNVPGLLWEDDRVSVISTLIVEWEKAKKADSKWIMQIAVL